MGVGKQDMQLQRESKASEGWTSWRESIGQGGGGGRESGDPGLSAFLKAEGRSLLTRWWLLLPVGAKGRELLATLELLRLRREKPGS